MAKKGAGPIQMVLSVVVVCAVSSGGLAMTYAVTKDRIAEQERAALNKALAAVVPGGVSFQPVDESLLAASQDAAGETPIYGVYAALDEAGNPVGYGVQAGPRGYSGPIRMVVGVDRDGKVAGVMVVTHNETPGLGTKAVGTDESATVWRSQFVGSESAAVVKDMDVISGATKSSRGVRTGVEAVMAAYESVLAKEVGQ